MEELCIGNYKVVLLPTFYTKVKLISPNYTHSRETLICSFAWQPSMYCNPMTDLSHQVVY